MNKLKYETALVTGASRGLGRALALGLAEDGVRLALVARGRKELESVASEIRTRYGSEYPVITLAGDIGDKEAIHPLAAQAARAIGPIELLIHNASQLGSVPLRLLMDTDCEELESVLQSNLVGPFRLSKLLVGPMLLRGHGLVVSISSDAAVEAYPLWGSYSVSKVALDHLTRIFAAELEGSGVRFLSIDPGEMDTVMHAQAMPDADPRPLTKPAQVADRIRAVIGGVERIANGSRLVAAHWGDAERRFGS